MLTAMQLEPIITQQLKRIEPQLFSSGHIWEVKTFNLHRAIIDVDARPNSSHAQFAAELRSELQSNVRISWWRGFAFGVIVRHKTFPQDIATCIDNIDGRNNSKGTWQWSIVVDESLRAVIGVHVWMQGRLTGVFEEALASYKQQGYQVCVCRKDKDALMKFLSALHPLPEFKPASETESL